MIMQSIMRSDDQSIMCAMISQSCARVHACMHACMHAGIQCTHTLTVCSNFAYSNCNSATVPCIQGMAMHADKRRKLFDLEAMRRRLPHVSQRGLSATLKDIRKHGLPDLDGTKDLREARELMVNEKTPYGPIGVDKDIPTTGGGSVKVRMASPLALLFFAFLHCAPFAEFMEQRFIEHPSTVDIPWNAILYCDEVHPGDQLGGKKLRKSHDIYLSFKEFGIAGLSNENLWFTIATVRTQVVNQIPGAMSNVFSVILREMFVDGPLADLGLLLENANGRKHRFFCKAWLFHPRWSSTQADLALQGRCWLQALCALS